MRIMKTLFVGGAGLAAIAAAAPASAQYSPYGYSQYGYANQYGSQYGYGNQYGTQYGGMNTQVAAQQCTAAVQNRLYNRTSIGGILGAVLGANTASGRVASCSRRWPGARPGRRPDVRRPCGALRVVLTGLGGLEAVRHLGEEALERQLLVHAEFAPQPAFYFRRPALARTARRGLSGARIRRPRRTSR